MKKAIIFGNGLGMALDPSSYGLPNAMKAAWSDASLGDDQKALISACLPGNSGAPTAEEQLSVLQDTVTACEVLVNVQKTSGDHWLTAQGQGFPDAVYRFSFLVARQMHLATFSNGPDQGNKCKLPSDFVEPLAQFIKQTSSHIATLNYDGLLASALIESEVLDCDKPVLLDGFLSSKFDRQNLFRPKGKGGWYMHLHGSPLFADRPKARPYKLSESTLKAAAASVRNAGKHVVLTHFRHKPKLIESSEILSTYWEFLDIAIEESSEIVLFGYSGNDLHLNRLISQVRGNRTLKIIEWLGSGTKDARNRFWSEQLGGAIELRLLEDVLTFSDW